MVTGTMPPMMLWNAEGVWRAIAVRNARNAKSVDERRLVGGNFSATRYHLAASESKTLRVRAALLAMHAAPQVVRQLYVALRKPAWPSTARAQNG